jgi:hypothetical protein
MATTPDSRSTSNPGESRNGNFHGSAGMYYHHNGVAVPRNGMNENRDIPRFGGGDYSDVDDGDAGIDYHDSVGRRAPGDYDD